MLLCLFKISIGQAQEHHWSCDAYAYQYDMTAYVAVVLNGNAIENYSNFEIAAFCDSECRGVATVQTSEKEGLSATYGYLRIRSNKQGGESIRFKVYNRQTAKEMVVTNLSVQFMSQGVVGLPSSPLILRVSSFNIGDVNGDDYVNESDITALTDVISGNDINAVVRSRADLNKDGKIDVADIITLANLLSKE